MNDLEIPTAEPLLDADQVFQSVVREEVQAQIAKVSAGIPLSKPCTLTSEHSLVTVSAIGCDNQPTGEELNKHAYDLSDQAAGYAIQLLNTTSHTDVTIMVKHLHTGIGIEIMRQPKL